MFIRLLTVLGCVIGIVAFLWGVGLYRAHRENSELVSKHVVQPSQRRVIDLRPAVYAQLPKPVRRYFEFAFNGRDEVVVDWVEWSEDGDFLLPVGRFRAAGTQASRPTSPEYAWTGTFWRLGLPMLESRDAFFVDRHDMRAKLFGWFKVMHTDYDDPSDRRSLHSYLVLRYFGQAPLMPWALLPNDHVRWVAHDSGSAYLEVTREGLAGRYLVRFAADGRIESMETDRLLMEGNGIRQKEIGLKGE
ncbi:MAG: DUF6544 family protein [Burkholderiaceae bacterium]